MANSPKYIQRVPRSEVKRMIKSGYRVVYTSIDNVRQFAVGNAGDVWDIPAYQNKVGYVLVDPDDYPISPEVRQYASQAWDDILI